MTNKEKADIAIIELEKEYPDAECSLNYSNPLQLLIATRLSAQCTDKRVNMVTPQLFAKYKNVNELANANVQDIAEIIRSCGFYKTKSQDIVNMSKRIVEVYNSEVPDTIEELVTLSGIGRKTANLVVGDVYGKPAVVVDTHCIRLTSRLGIHKIKDATKIEKILREILPPDKSNDFCHRLVLHGRAVCDARKPKCEQCCINYICEYYDQNKYIS